MDERSDEDVEMAEVEDVADAGDAVDDDAGDGILDRLRGTGAGVEDPNIVGDVGPTDVAPGSDPDGGLDPA